MEIWDAYDAKLNKIDEISLIRGEEIPDGMFHLCSEIIVRHKDGTYLIMQRDARKHLGGMWEEIPVSSSNSLWAQVIGSSPCKAEPPAVASHIPPKCFLSSRCINRYVPSLCLTMISLQR